MKHISEIIQLEALVIRIVYVCCVDTNERPIQMSNTREIEALEIKYY